MENPGRERTRFDQQAALEELERFGRDIERYRAQREALGDEFETFVRSFKTPPDRDVPPSGPLTRAVPRVPPAALPSPPVAAAPPSPPMTAAAPLPVTAAAPPPPAVAETRVATVAEPPVAAGVPRIATAPAPRGGSTFGSPAVAGGALLAVLAGGMLVAMLWNRAPEPAAPAPATTDPPAAAPASSSQPRPAAPAPAAAQDTSESAITTVRRVWMRVVVDGERVLEREVPAGTRVPLKAEKTIVIRTGDAGAVRLSMRGEDRGVLGAEGEVVTRSFAVPPRQAPVSR